VLFSALLSNAIGGVRVYGNQRADPIRTGDDRWRSSVVDVRQSHGPRRIRRGKGRACQRITSILGIIGGRISVGPPGYSQKGRSGRCAISKCCGTTGSAFIGASERGF